MHSNNLTGIFTSGLLALVCALPAAAANLAGSAVFVSGKPTATDPAGGVRELKARDEVYSGDLLETGKGRVQIKFVDGAFMSIQPNSRFQVEDYNYTSGSDGSEKAVYNLFKGGMRAFTGAIGKKHPDAYKVKTPVATIGIRGTGHNTRVCSGDCTGSNGLPLPDGLYHSTWEGTTFVENDAGISEVPFGNSVYVKSIDSPAEQTNEASQVTAVQPSEDVVEELAEEQEEQVTLEEGEQLDCVANVCFPASIPPPGPDPVTTQVGLNQVSVAPQQPSSGDSVDISLLFETTEFIGPDGPVGAFGTDVNDGPPGTGTLATIDPNGILASSSPAAAEAKTLINNAMANPDNDALFDAFYANPASIAEFTVDSGIGFGRWFNGLVLLFEDDGSVALKSLENDESLHFIFGNSPAVAAANAVGTYDFVGGTRSTGSLGDGVTDGQLTFDFADMSGTIAMTVSHGLIYTIEGDLLIDVVFPSLFADDGTLKATTTSGFCSVGSGCTAFIEGSFFGPLVEGAPAGAGLEYDIQENAEVIMGVAAFTRVANPPPTPPELTQLPNQTLLGIEPVLMPDALDNDNADTGLLSDTTVLVGSDSVGTNGMAGALGTELDEDDLGNDQLQQTLLTIDPNGILDVSSPDSAVSVAQGFITSALNAGGADAAAVNAVIADPAKVAEHTEGTFKGSNFAYGRWTGGQVLFIHEVTEPGPNLGIRTVEADDLPDDQSLIYQYGDAAATNFGASATGTYNLLNDGINGGVRSTSTNGGPVLVGVQSGTLAFDFTTLDGTIDMEVLHDTAYMVAGDLRIDVTAPVKFENVFDGVSAVTSSAGPCEQGCETLIEGSFFGQLDGSGVDGAPVLAGLDYEIIIDPFNPGTLTGESIIGNAIFGRSGPAAALPFTLESNQGMVTVQPNPAPFPPPDEFAEVGTFFDVTTITGKDSVDVNGLLAAIGTEFDDGSDPEAELFTLTSIDPIGLFALDVEPGSDEERAQLLYNTAVADPANNALFNAYLSDPTTVANPAKVAEFFQGEGFAFTRWADGDVLALTENVGGGGTFGEQTATVYTLAGGLNGQSLHEIHGETPATPTAGATGVYTFIDGTQSTTVSGTTIGDGVTGGTLAFDFDNLSGSLAMNVNHNLTNYTVGGPLALNPVDPGTFFDAGVSATTAGTGSDCFSGCATFIDGGFAGALSGVGGGIASPAIAGLEYDIDASDGIMGVAAFGRTGP